MCEFLSWKEKGGRLYYLTDDDIFSEYGREKLKGCKDNDYLGHGAIALYYDMTNGTDYERRDFWADGLPDELKEKVANFDRWWGKAFKKYFQNDDLRYIIRFAPEPWNEKAWELLLTQSPSNDDLHYIICSAPKPWNEKAAEQLLTQSPSNDYLRYIICSAPEPWNEKAWELLLTQSPSNDDLRYIIRYVPEPWNGKAAEQLLTQSPSNDYLRYIIRYAPKPWNEKAAEQLFKTIYNING